MWAWHTRVWVTNETLNYNCSVGLGWYLLVALFLVIYGLILLVSDAYR